MKDSPRLAFDAQYIPGQCPYCKRRFDPVDEFRDAGSVREYWVTGRCQECQDVIFGYSGQPPPDPKNPSVMLAPKTLH
jgi:hypothetical protein